MPTHLRHEVLLAAPPERIYAAILSSSEHANFTGGGVAEIIPEAGGAWSAFGGHIHGRTIELVPDVRIVQAWRSADWPAGHYSIVKFELAPEGTGTKLTMEHSGITEERRTGQMANGTLNRGEPDSDQLGGVKAARAAGTVSNDDPDLLSFRPRRLQGPCIALPSRSPLRHPAWLRCLARSTCPFPAP